MSRSEHRSRHRSGSACWAPAARSAPRSAGRSRRPPTPSWWPRSTPATTRRRARDRAGAEVVVDFTHPDVVMDNLRFCIEHGIHAVVGTTGFDQRPARPRSRPGSPTRRATGVLIAPNFSIGAILMMRFAAQAAPFYESVEVVELHHPDKADAPVRHRAAYGGADRRRPPRGRLRARARRDVDRPRRRPRRRRRRRPRARPADPRPGGAPGGHPRRAGETLTIRHDSLDRVSFTPGVLAGVRADRRPPGPHRRARAFLDLG